MIAQLEASDLYHWNKTCQAQVIVNQGGTSSGKTYSILQVLFTIACERPDSVITVAGQDIPNLKVGAMRDAATIVQKTKLFAEQIESFNKTDRVYKFKNGSVIEFNSYDDEQDAKSGKRDYLFVNEANGIPYKVYEQLALRTRFQVFIDYNPNEEFWVHEFVIGQEGVQLFISDHRHNPFLSDVIRRKIEALKDKDIELWKVYARGLTGKIEGLIYRNYHMVKAVPEQAKLIAGGLDFGYTNDPTSFLNVYKMDDELYIDELIYESAMTNPDIANRLTSLGVKRHHEIYADSSEPKSIKEISNYDFNIMPVDKGPDSVKNGIDVLKRYKLNITESSHGLKKEIKSYKWKVDNSGKPLNVPVDFMNHSLDALRYVALMKLNNNNYGKYTIL